MTDISTDRVLRPVPLRDVVAPAKAAPDPLGVEAFFELSSDLLGIVDMREGRWRKVNPATVRTLGWNEGVLLAMPIIELMHPEDIPQARELLARVALGEEIGTNELRLRHVDGSYRRIEWTLSAHPTAGLVYAVGRDVTNLRETQASLRSTESRLRAIFEALPVGVAIFDGRDKASSLNPAAIRLHGFDTYEASVVSRGPAPAYGFELLDDAGRPVPREDWPAQRAARGEAVDGLELWIRRPDGSRRRVAYHAAPLADEMGIVLAFEDVTDRDAARRALEASETLFRGTFENAAVGITHVDDAGRIVRVNARFAEILRYDPPEALLGVRFQDITHPDDLAGDLAQKGRLESGEIDHFAMEKRYLRPDGTAVWCELTVSAARRPDGTIDHYIGVVQDITERREADARLRDALAVKDEFLGLVSHELRTPMTVIYGMSRILAKSDLSPEMARETAIDIAESADVLNDLIESMLLLARLDRGEASHHLMPHPLHKVAADAIARVRLRDPRTRYDLEVRSADTLVEVNVGWVERVIENLLSNAVKYGAPNEPVRIVVDADEDEVRLSVIDRGPGLDEDHLAKAFEPFYRAPGAAERAPGAGLGLAVSRRIVELLGGRIWGRRISGGAEFGFGLPRFLDEA